MASESREGRRGFWQAAIRRQAESSLPVARFCKREGLHPVTFYGWRRKLQREAGQTGSRVPAESKPMQRMPALVPVRLLDSPESMAVEVVSPRGWVLRVQAGVDTDHARRVLHLLQEIG
jgi:transposase-like protein